ncbi:SpoIIE family protein phosphatase [Streptomyces sp. JJ36]|uniref:SpoIIE family protein phosphatase n=1 Tax=Streptomyces sp. JJ36 TaxID=2736645 RepID=UPI001F44C5B5|nr:SpoIIE family protein phosphatase [Streptomyces sp. JJ36]MCF6522274.1 SpoIIE family protein phosphatase [Streptomyces sp. JJ36]
MRHEELPLPSPRFAPAVPESRVGGDLHAVCDSPYGLRVLIGDVRGKGATAAGGADALLAGFRTAARSAATLPGVVNALEDTMARYAAARQDGVAEEDFASAVVAEFTADGRTLRLLNHAHPAPFLLRPGSVQALEPVRPGLPLGLGALGPAGRPPEPLTVPFPADGTLLLLTDGTTEARDADGAFYDPLPRLARHGGAAPEDLVRLLRREVRDHTAGRLAAGRARTPDDMAVLAVRPHRTTAGVTAPAPVSAPVACGPCA